MELRYDAFISYRHAEVDMAAAKYVQRWLEHFHVPASVARSAGKSKIARVFRDKDELPLTSNLGDDIMLALENADFLIVICSPRTKESPWVQREIDHFLSCHDISRVLTVIAEGEPYEVIPECLTWTEKELPDETGSTKRVRFPLEPLSCDLRIGKRRAAREEMPRLAAAILGCPYDALVQRARQYRMRITASILSVIFLALAGFSAYVWQSSRQIQANYLQSLRNQSVYLATESAQALKEGDRMTAIRLALEALPREDADRPYIPKAEQALLSAVSAYITEYISSANLLPKNTFALEADVQAICVSDDEEWIAAFDDSHTVTVWDTVSGRLCSTYSLKENSIIAPNDFGFIGFSGSDSLLFTAGQSVFCLDIADGTIRWQKTIGEDGSFDHVSGIFTGSKDQLLVNDHVHTLYLLQAETGEIQNSWTLDRLDGSYSLFADTGSFSMQDPMAISDSGRYAAAGVLVLSAGDAFGTMGSGWTVILLDLAEGKYRCLPIECQSVQTLGFSEDDRLIVHTLPPDGSFSQYFFGGNLMTHATDLISAWDPVSGVQSWEQQTATAQKYRHSELLCTSVTGENGETKDALILICGNKALFLDLSDGTVLRTVEASGAVLDAAIVNGTHLNLLTEDGYHISTALDDKDYWTMLRNADAGLALGRLGQTQIWTVKGSESSGDFRILQYSRNVTDGSFNALQADEADLLLQNTLICDDAIVLAGWDGLLLSDGDVSHPLRYVDLTDRQLPAELTVLGLSETRDEAVLYAAGSSEVFFVRTSDGSCRTIRLTEDENCKVHDLVWTGGSLCSLQETADPSSASRHLSLAVMAPEGQTRSLPVADADSTLRYSLAAGPDGTILILAAAYSFSEGTSHLYLADLQKDSVTELAMPEEWSKEGFPEMARDITAWSTDGGAFALINENTVFLFEKDGTKTAAIDNGSDLAVYGTVFCPDGGIMTVSEDAVLRYYSPDGKMRWTLPLDSTAFSCGDIRWIDGGDGILMILCGDSMNLLNTDEQLLMTTISGCHGYQSESRRFICKDLSGYGWRERYTLDSLIARAEEILGSYDLTSRQKAAYGLSDETASTSNTGS